jgi:hypothetical protein
MSATKKPVTCNSCTLLQMPSMTQVQKMWVTHCQKNIHPILDAKGNKTKFPSNFTKFFVVYVHFVQYVQIFQNLTLKST